MASSSLKFETGHEEMIHDAQLDYYGKRLATASSDRTIKIFDIVDEKQTFACDIKGHDGPVWEVAWAHPKFGTLLASCSYDGKIMIWKESSRNMWVRIFDYSTQCSVNAVAWAPHTFGLMLLAARSDGKVSVFQFAKGETSSWDHKEFLAHKGGCNAVSWGPDMKTGALLSKDRESKEFVRRFVTAGCDNRLRMWRYNSQAQGWTEQENVFEAKSHHRDWVRDASWAPSLGLPCNTIASCSEDKTVAIWTEDQNGAWKRAAVLPFDHKVWRVSWSTMGNILAVSQGDNKVSLWKESTDGKWSNLSNMSDAAAGGVTENKESRPLM